MTLQNTPSVQIHEDFEKLFETHAKQHDPIEGTIVRGTITGNDNKYIIINVGGKSEGRIPVSEFMGKNGEMPQIGDSVDVLIERLEGRSGYIMLSREKARNQSSWNFLEQQLAKNATVMGRILGRLKGGYAVEIESGLSGETLIAFLPGSLADLKPLSAYELQQLMQADQAFKILKMDLAHGNIVVSRKAILEEARDKSRKELFAVIKEGMVLKGRVKNITDYGAFIDLFVDTGDGAPVTGYADGLLHIIDMSWYKISHPSQLLKLGEEVQVMVIKYNSETNKISLGLKQLQKNPWENIAESYAPKSRHFGEVIAIKDYGAFVKLQENVEGLVYITEINWLAKNVHPSKLLKVGDKVEVEILSIDVDKHRISLSIKACQANPWVIFKESHPMSTTLDLIIKEVSDLGLFTTLKDDADKELALRVLVPASELSWEKVGEDALKEFVKGAELRGVLQDIDVEKERIIASVKQLSEDTVMNFVRPIMKANSVSVRLVEIKKEGMMAELLEDTEYNIPVIIEKTEVSRFKDDQNTEDFTKGEIIQVKMLAFDRKDKVLTASIKALQQLEAASDKSTNSESGHFGAALGDAMRQ